MTSYTIPEEVYPLAGVDIHTVNDFELRCAITYMLNRSQFGWDEIKPLIDEELARKRLRIAKSRQRGNRHGVIDEAP